MNRPFPYQVPSGPFVDASLRLQVEFSKVPILDRTRPYRDHFTSWCDMVRAGAFGGITIPPHQCHADPEEWISDIDTGDVVEWTLGHATFEDLGIRLLLNWLQAIQVRYEGRMPVKRCLITAAHAGITLPSASTAGKASPVDHPFDISISERQLEDMEFFVRFRRPPIPIHITAQVKAMVEAWHSFGANGAYFGHKSHASLEVDPGDALLGNFHWHEADQSEQVGFSLSHTCFADVAIDLLANIVNFIHYRMCEVSALIVREPFPEE